MVTLTDWNQEIILWQYNLYYDNVSNDLILTTTSSYWSFTIFMCTCVLYFRAVLLTVELHWTLQCSRCLLMLSALSRSIELWVICTSLNIYLKTEVNTLLPIGNRSMQFLGTSQKLTLVSHPLIVLYLLTLSLNISISLQEI